MKLFASREPLHVPEEHERLHNVKGACAIEPGPMADLGERERGLGRGKRLQDAEAVN